MPTSPVFVVPAVDDLLKVHVTDQSFADRWAVGPSWLARYGVGTAAHR